MSKLKTLKDLKLRGNRREYDLCSDDLKQEAIKWVKSDLKQLKVTRVGNETMIKRWAKRFDISEEELKDE